MVQEDEDERMFMSIRHGVDSRLTHIIMSQALAT
jgi:hypothetical protein